MKAVILAAGLGSRMKHMTKDLPKCLAITLNGKTLLDTQLETLKSCGIHDISIVRGYKAETISLPSIKYYLNDNYKNNNILESLFYAEPDLNGDVIVSYSDIWYEADIVRKLQRCGQDIALAVDVEWRNHYVGRTQHPVSEAENVLVNDRQEVVRIGKIGAEGREVHGEFIGMMKLTPKGCEIFKSHYHRAKKLHDGKPFQRAAVFQKAYLTDMLQEMADAGIPIHCEVVGSKWKEIDTIEDFERAMAFVQTEKEGQKTR